MSNYIGGTKPAGLYTVSASHLADGDTLVVDGKTFTYKNTIGADGNVYLPTGGADAQDVIAVANMILALNRSAGQGGTNYVCTDLTTPRNYTAAAGTTTRLIVVTDNVAHATSTIAFAATGTAGTVDATPLGTFVAGANRTVFAPAYASLLLTVSGGHLADTETVTLDGKVYTFKTTLTNTAGYVYLSSGGAAADDALGLANLTKAINLSGTAGVDYAASTTVHPTVRATNPSTTTLNVIAKYAGPMGHLIPAGETCAYAAFAGGAVLLSATAGKAAQKLTSSGVMVDTQTVTIGGKVYTFQASLTGGDGHVQLAGSGEQTASFASLVAAINLGGTAGTDYDVATTIHPSVTAVLSADKIRIYVIAKSYGTASNYIGTTQTCTNAAFGNTTLLTGTGDGATPITDVLTLIKSATQENSDVAPLVALLLADLQA